MLTKIARSPLALAGIGDDIGVLVTGARNAEFPTEQDRLLLGVGANQTAIVLGRLRTEAEVRDQREWLRVTLASIGDGVITADAVRNVTYLNSVAQKLTGWSLVAAVGRPLSEVYQIVSEGKRQKVENPALRALATGRVVGQTGHTLLAGRDGTARPIDDSAAPIRDAAGSVGGAVLIFRDTTERKHVETSLRAREARYRMLVTATSDVVYHMNADWSEMQPLDGRDLVVSNSEPIQDWLQKNTPLAEHGLVREAINRAIVSHQTFELEHHAIRPDGSVGWAFSSAVPILNAEGRVIEWFGTARDVTDLPGLRSLFPAFAGARAIIRIRCERIADSCGFGVLLCQFQGDRTQLTDWAEKKGPEALAEYQRQKNASSIDGLTGL